MKLTPFAALLLAPLAMTAQAEVTFTPMAGYQWFDTEIIEEASNGGIQPDIEASEGYALALGYRFTKAFGLEVNYGRTESNTEVLGLAPSTEVRNSRLSLDGYYTFNPENTFSPYVLLGLGQNRMKSPATAVLEDSLVNAAVGAFWHINENVALRMEARNLHNVDAELADQIVLLGLEFSGSATESKAEPAPQQAEEAPAPVEVLAAAPLDTDGDGVADAQDQCPNTPAGTAVNASGCPLDGDKDGVADAQDQCPTTPAGITVDASGCPLDGDKDGVADSLDKCLGTAAGVVVDNTGCDKILTEAINLELKVSFDSGKAIVKDEFKPEIAKAAAIMKQYPSAYMEIQGHTDSSGRATANNALSQQRADAVRAVLVNEYGVAGDHITAKGYGSSQPIADNKTAEGKTKNRRVIAIVTGEAKRVMKKK